MERVYTFAFSTRNFKKAASLFLDSISTFTMYEILLYETFIFYTVLTSIITLDRVSLKQKVFVDLPGPLLLSVLNPVTDDNIQFVWSVLK